MTQLKEQRLDDKEQLKAEIKVLKENNERRERYEKERIS